jgi:two-component system sensor histidine kinase/response regulator
VVVIVIERPLAKNLAGRVTTLVLDVPEVPPMDSRPLLNSYRHRVLVADDDRPSQIIVRTLLEKRGYVVAVVGNGWDAVAAIKREHFDIVLMDLQMPIMDGYSAVLTGEHLPIVAVTAQSRNGSEELCVAAGMDGYITKPFRMGELLSALERYLYASLPTPTLEKAMKDPRKSASHNH